VVTLAAAEIGLGLGIVLLVYRTRSTIAVDRLDDLGELREDLAQPFEAER
jgi:NADH-quinone oxidoreductase subunit K